MSVDDVLLSDARHSRASDSLWCNGVLHSEEGFSLLCDCRPRRYHLNSCTLPPLDEGLTSNNSNTQTAYAQKTYEDETQYDRICYPMALRLWSRSFALNPK